MEESRYYYRLATALPDESSHTPTPDFSPRSFPKEEEPPSQTKLTRRLLLRKTKSAPQLRDDGALEWFADDSYAPQIQPQSIISNLQANNYLQPEPGLPDSHNILPDSHNFIAQTPELPPQNTPPQNLLQHQTIPAAPPPLTTPSPFSLLTPSTLTARSAALSSDTVVGLVTGSVGAAIGLAGTTAAIAQCYMTRAQTRTRRSHSPQSASACDSAIELSSLRPAQTGSSSSAEELAPLAITCHDDTCMLGDHGTEYEWRLCHWRRELEAWSWTRGLELDVREAGARAQEAENVRVAKQLAEEERMVEAEEARLDAQAEALRTRRRELREDEARSTAELAERTRALEADEGASRARVEEGVAVVVRRMVGARVEALRKQHVGLGEREIALVGAQEKLAAEEEKLNARLRAFAELVNDFDSKYSAIKLRNAKLQSELVERERVVEDQARRLNEWQMILRRVSDRTRHAIREQQLGISRRGR
ncbi:uncharacterized protein BDZ99DRAFT_577329 [Mytilinidion resinicola]|uniref:Uncharacterized protein n=1 Tax=Mytilinidion resinicola TaxID=574789 RepID=A0A6A6Y0Y1_9PEZI|nr:uncharacterized protein BDZ99DRAFT_577329 [Mytilinidion resinicola]KAF2801885.1 hypothetical protein BDZ99DRAFT_577329 [Mytilinidion resinicola]